MNQNLLYKLGLLVATLVMGFTSSAQVTFERIGEFQASGGFDEGGSEIISYDTAAKRIYSTNGALGRVDVIDLTDPTNPVIVDSLAIDTIGGGINSVAVHSEKGYVVIAVENFNKQDDGYAVFFDTDGNYITKIIAGALPDMVTTTKDGNKVILANEGEPNADYSNDPEGSITIIDIPADLSTLSQDDAYDLPFTSFNAYKDELKEEGVRLFGGATPVDVIGWTSDSDSDVDTVLVDLTSVDAVPSFKLLSAFRAGAFDEGATEIIAFDATNSRVFSTNSDSGRVDMINVSDPENPFLEQTLGVDSIGGAINSVAVYGNIVAAAVENSNKQANGFVVFFDTDGNYLAKVTVGALPDMVTFTPDGSRVLVANEGEPNADYSNDPEGSVSIIRLPADVSTVSNGNVTTADFNGFDALKQDLIDAGVRIFGGVEAQPVTNFFARNDDDVDSVVVADASNFSAGDFITIDSDNSDDDADFVRAYQILEVDGNTVILTTEFDYDIENNVVVEGTDIGADPSAWTVYLNDASATVSEDLEPEYIAVNATGDTAFVTLQENNAVAIVDILNEEIIAVAGLGTKDHSLEENALDASNRDDEINITTHPVLGMYMPDAISSFEANGKTYYITANEGDAREYDALIEESDIRHFPLDPTAFPNDDFQSSSVTGRLHATLANGDTDGDGDFDELYSYGGRSFTVWGSDGTLLWDSGDDFEQITSELFPAEFNSTNDETAFDDRSDNKGPEPEAITTGTWMGTTYAFIGLERMGGIMVYDMTNPLAPEYVTYVRSRDYDADPEESNGMAPEDIKFVSSSDSPNGKAMLVVSNEVSGTVELFEISNANEIMAGQWITIDSDNSNDDVDFVRSYQIESFDGVHVVLTTAFDIDVENNEVVEGTDTSAVPSDWTVYLMNNPSTVAQDLEPEYIAVAPNDSIAVVTLQENNAVAVVGLYDDFIGISALGDKDHSLAGNGLDANDRDDAALIEQKPVFGMFMPDAIAAFEKDGETYYVTANEGDAREYDAMIEEIRMKDLPLDFTAFPNASTLQEDEGVGRLNSSIFDGDFNMDGEYEELYAYGARSFTVWDGEGEFVWDSGDDFEQITATEFPLYFNSTNDEAELDNRSDNKGPEPEAITTGVFNDSTYIFIGLERMGGFMVYLAEDPTNPEFVTYVNDRDYAAAPEEQGDLAPEDIKFVPQDENGEALIIISNEVSGTVAVYTMTADAVNSTNGIFANEGMFLFPNPVADAFTLTVPVSSSEQYEVQMTNSRGMVVKTESVVGSDNTISVANLNAGLYFVKVETAGSTYQSKVIVE